MQHSSAIVFAWLLFFVCDLCIIHRQVYIWLQLNVPFKIISFSDNLQKLNFPTSNYYPLYLIYFGLLKWLYTDANYWKSWKPLFQQFSASLWCQTSCRYPRPVSKMDQSQQIKLVSANERVNTSVTLHQRFHLNRKSELLTRLGFPLKKPK